MSELKKVGPIGFTELETKRLERGAEAMGTSIEGYIRHCLGFTQEPGKADLEVSRSRTGTGPKSA